MNRFTKQRMKAAKQKCRKTCSSGLFKQSAAAASTIQQSIKGQIQIGLINASGNRQFSVVSNVAADFSAERNALRVGQWPTQEWQSSPLPGCTCKSIKEWRILTGLLSSNYTCISDVRIVTGIIFSRALLIWTISSWHNCCWHWECWDLEPTQKRDLERLLSRNDSYPANCWLYHHKQL